jgi:hypothetical protein
MSMQNFIGYRERSLRPVRLRRQNLKKAVAVRHLISLMLLVFLPSSASSSESVLALLAPYGGEAIQSGGISSIQWEASPEMVDFTLAYSVDRGLTWITIGDAAAGSSLDWATPAVEGDSVGCIVKVAGFNASGEQVSECSSEVFLAPVLN